MLSKSCQWAVDYPQPCFFILEAPWHCLVPTMLESWLTFITCQVRGLPSQLFAVTCWLQQLLPGRILGKLPPSMHSSRIELIVVQQLTCPGL